MILRFLCALTLVLAGQLNLVSAAENTGAHLANESMALVTYAAMSNLGASDPVCVSGQFERFDINILVEAEVAPVINRLAAARPGEVSQEQRELMLTFLKNMQKHPTAATGIEQIYRTKKSDAIAQYGVAGGCPALATMIKTVIQQKRLALRHMQ